MSERILSFAYLMCPSVSRPKALKKCLRFAIFNFSEKLQSIFEIGLKRYGVFIQKSLIEKIFRKKKFASTYFCCLCVNPPTVKIWGQQDKFSMSFSFLHCPLQVKKMIRENNAKLNMSIRRVIFTSGQNLKPPFLCQYLIFFNDFFLHQRFHLDHYFHRKKSKFGENCRSEGIL